MFKVADMEEIPLPDGCIDVVISNGAFCLAPNKEKAFREIFRVLRPGGRISICTSTVKMDLQAGVHWPICMRMFIHINEILPLCS
jgi:ubiquinone/menaquinone biosynthesis C-methylase UbiE